MRMETIDANIRKVRKQEKMCQEDLAEKAKSYNGGAEKSCALSAPFFFPISKKI